MPILLNPFLAAIIHIHPINIRVVSATGVQSQQYMLRVIMQHTDYPILSLRYMLPSARLVE